MAAGAKHTRTVKNTVYLGETYLVEAHDVIITGNADDIRTRCPDTWERVPRGCCRVIIRSMLDGGGVLYDRHLVGLRKFTYDDAPPPSLSATMTVFTEKEDGECFHVTACVLPNDDVLWIGGSKQVHGVVRAGHVEDDIVSWERAAPRYQGMFGEFMRRFFDLGYATPRLARWLYDNAYTLCGEHCSVDREHLVKYDTSDIRFYAVTVDEASSERGWTAMNPVTALPMLAAEFGLSVVSWTEALTPDEVEAERRRFFDRRNCEGAVLYTIDLATDQVTWIAKYKTRTYTVRRAIREKIVAGATHAEIMARIDALHIPVEDRAALEEFCLGFAAMVRGLAPDVIRESWVTLEAKYDALPDPERRALIELGRQGIAATGTAEPRTVVICIAPCPGLGKSTVCASLAAAVGSQAAVVISQDQFGGVRGKFLAALRTAMRNPALRWIFVDKNNAAVRHRVADYAGFYTEGFRVVYLNFVVPPGTPSGDIVALAETRIRARGLRHETLYPTAELPAILGRFVHMYAAPTEVERTRAAAVVDVDVTASLETMVSVAAAGLGIAPGPVVDPSPRPRLDRTWWAIFFDKETCDMLRSLVEPHLASAVNIKWIKEMHVTLAYAPRSMDVVEALPTTATFTVRGFVVDQRRAAVFVLDDDAARHITAAVLPGTKPGHSTAILEAWKAGSPFVVYHALPAPLTVSGRLGYRAH